MLTEPEETLVSSGVSTCRHDGVLRERSTCPEHAAAHKALGVAFGNHAIGCRYCRVAIPADAEFEDEDLCAAGLAMLRALVPRNACHNPDDSDDEPYAQPRGLRC